MRLSCEPGRGRGSSSICPYQCNSWRRTLHVLLADDLSIVGTGLRGLVRPQRSLSVRARTS